MICFALLYGPMGAFLPELFRVRHRYSGASFAYNAAGVVGGGVSPIIATALLAGTGTSAWVAIYLMAIGLVCLVSVALLRETKDSDFTDGLTAPARTAPR
jgi:nitrate/nitrite transporter NarK